MANGYKLAEVAARPEVFDKACSTVYKRIPIPWRWILGKKRIAKLMTKLKEQIIQTQSETKIPSKDSAHQ